MKKSTVQIITFKNNSFKIDQYNAVCVLKINKKYISIYLQYISYCKLNNPDFGM